MRLVGGLRRLGVRPIVPIHAVRHDHGLDGPRRPVPQGSRRIGQRRRRANGGDGALRVEHQHGLGVGEGVGNKGEVEGGLQEVERLGAVASWRPGDYEEGEMGLLERY
jgi:hypothetical protein